MSMSDIEVFEIFSRTSIEAPNQPTKTTADKIADSLMTRLVSSGSNSYPKPDYEFNFVYEIHDGALIVTKQKYTLGEFEKFSNEINVVNWEPIQFTGTLRI